MSGGQSRSQAEAKRWAEASADDPVENRRGRPRTRLDHPSDLLDRVKTGGEIRSYIRKKTNNVPVSKLSYYAPNDNGADSDVDPKQSLLKALTKIVSNDKPTSTMTAAATRDVSKGEKREKIEADGEASNESGANFEKITIDSSISDTEKLKLLQSNSLVNRKSKSSSEVSTVSSSVTEEGKEESSLSFSSSNSNNNAAATTTTTTAASSLSPSSSTPSNSASLSSPPNILKRRRPEVMTTEKPAIIIADPPSNPQRKTQHQEHLQQQQQPPQLQDRSDAYPFSLSPFPENGQLPKRYGKRAKILLDRPMSINIDEDLDMNMDEGLGKKLTTEATTPLSQISPPMTTATSTTATIDEGSKSLSPFDAAAAPALKRFRPIAPAPRKRTPPPTGLSDAGGWSDCNADVGPSSSASETIKCFFCRFEALDRMEFFLHMRQEHLVDPIIKCNICAANFADDDALKAHCVKEHFTCKLCGYVEMGNAQGIETHLTFHHNDEERRHSCGGRLEPVDLPIPAGFDSPSVEANHLQCESCGVLTTYQQFFDSESLSKSRTTRHFRHECAHCPYETRDEEAFERHRHHHDKSRWKLDKCRLCDFVSHEELVLKGHQQQHLKGTALKCETCRFYTIGENRMALHRTVHTGQKPLKCSYCNFIAVNPRILSHHLKNHFNDMEPLKGDLIVKCGQCDYHGLWQDVDAHVRTHAKAENHKCVLCSREFATKTGYKKHLQQHMGEYPFPCPQCERGFFDEYTLRDHIFAHQGIKPYQCVCGTKYQRKKNLVFHEKSCVTNQEQLLRNYGQGMDRRPAAGLASKGAVIDDGVEERDAAPLDTWMRAGGVFEDEQSDEDRPLADRLSTE